MLLTHVHAVLDLALIFVRVKVSLRFGDQTVGPDLPVLKSADSHVLAGAAWTSVVTVQRPVKLHSLSAQD